VSAAPTYSPLDRPVQFLKGVGPRRAPLLQRLKLLTARDVLYHVPRRYEDATTVRPIRSLQAGEEATVIGRVFAKGVLPTRRGLRVFQAVIRDATGSVECSWVGQPHLDRVIGKGDLLLVSGAVRYFHGTQLQARSFEILARAGEQSTEEGGGVFPVYPATEGLTHRQVRAIIEQNLDTLLEEVAEEEPFEPELLHRAGIPRLEQALAAMHRPASIADAEQGRRRLAFEELFLQQLLHARARRSTTVERAGRAYRKLDTLARPFFHALPFELTGAQRRVLREIAEDMASEHRMNRLLQGDVGSGKTVVALFAMLRAIENGFQAALMAPTEILAEQHLRTIRSLVGPLDVPVHLLTGRLGSAERRTVLEAVGSDRPVIVVGTHALIQESVRFGRLGLAVVDEQHRFGVRQRMALGEMGDAVDVLVMSATPIPRSLALTLYGDLDISVLDEIPPGRRRVATGVRPASQRGRAWEFVREQVAAGRQAYVVYPLVEESERLELRAATEEYEQLSSEVFPELRVGLLHGQLPSEEKDRVMRAFAAHEIDILVATTVIEVGIDVPNATVMVVEHAERFGLSQLHQLRGRVGRGAEESYCVLINGAGEATERLRLFAQTDDGFRIAEADMRLRGQGDLFGSRQHGVPDFRFARLEDDAALLALAREEASRLIERDPRLAEHPRLRDRVLARFDDGMRLFGVG
jgi:ATP-dependent DNA helicase RecG